MNKIILFWLFLLPLHASQYPSFTDKDFLKMEKEAARIAQNRFINYQEQVKLFKTYKKEKQLNIVNHYLNQLLPQYDAILRNQEDYWATPKEFLLTGYGDCEDYVIIKYFTLLELGFDTEKLFLTTVYERYTGGYHMVLTYFKEDEKAPLVLDNLSFRILDLNTRSDLKAHLFINARGVFKIIKNNQLVQVADTSSKYTSLLKKVNKGL